MMAPAEKVMPDFCDRRYPQHYVTALNILKKMDIELDRVNLLAVGEYKNYRGEIIEQAPKPGAPLDRKTKITLHIGFSSAVDYMPYQFFYGMGGRRPSTGEWELRARTLMAPFDAAVIRYHTKARYQTLKYNFGVIDREYLKKYIDLFDFLLDDQFVDIEEILIWANVLPYFNLWSGNPVKVVKILEYIFRREFYIRENIAGEYEIPPRIQYRLGNKTGRLGKETVLGEKFTEYDSSYRLVMRAQTPEDIDEYMPGKPKRKKLEWVMKVCMPNQLDYELAFELKDRGMVLGREGRANRLGYSSFV